MYIMYRLCVFAVIITCTHINNGLYEAVSDEACPPWTYRPSPTAPCQCGSTLNGAIKCNMTAGVISLHNMCVCITYNSQSNESVAGNCPYACIANNVNPNIQMQMTTVNFTDLTCGAWNREGTLCSKCIKDYGFPLYSYSVRCVKCKEHFQIKELCQFLAMSLIPPTVLCIVITVLHISVLRPPWSVFVLAAQLLSTPFIMKAKYSQTYCKNFNDTDGMIILHTIFQTIYAVWHLDFFKTLYPPTCISPHITALHTFAIDGLIGLYPLFLVVVMYAFIALRDRGCKIVLIIWRPFNFILSRFRSRLNLKASLIDTFSTLFLLSYMKIGFASFCILTPTRVWSPNGSYVWALYIDPTLGYMENHHILFALPTFILSLTLLVAPIILLLVYPCTCFQSFLNRFDLQLLPLHTFVDAFQGCYKDGTHGTHDCRYFSGLLLFFRLGYTLSFLITQDVILSMFFSIVSFSLFIAVFAITRPYKRDIFNKTDFPLLLALVCCPTIEYVWILLHVFENHNSLLSLHAISAVLFSSPFLYFIICSVVLLRNHCAKRHQQSPQGLRLLVDG